MKNGRKKEKYVVVFVTSPDIETARSIVRKTLENKLVACANIVPNIESHYWWEGKIDKSSEVLIVMKTVLSKVNELERTVISEHPYKTPEFIAIKIEDGFRGYLEWVSESVSN